MRLDIVLVPAWPAVAGAAALAVAAALVLWLAPHWRDEAEARLAQMRSSARWAGPEARPQAQPIQEKAAPGWPAPAASPRRAAALSALARRQGLELLQLREQVDASAQLQLGMNGRASYPALRQFVERALAADPALVLDRLRLHRGEADELLVAFELQWTLLHRASPGELAAGPAVPAAVTAAVPAGRDANLPANVAVNAAANPMPRP